MGDQLNHIHVYNQLMMKADDQRFASTVAKDITRKYINYNGEDWISEYTFDFDKIIPCSLPNRMDEIQQRIYLWGTGGVGYMLCRFGDNCEYCGIEDCVELFRFLSFETLYTPPIKIIEELSKRYPNIQFLLRYWKGYDSHLTSTMGTYGEHRCHLDTTFHQFVSDGYEIPMTAEIKHFLMNQNQVPEWKFYMSEPQKKEVHHA